MRSAHFNLARCALFALAASVAIVCQAADSDDRYANDKELARFIDSMRGEDFALDAGRIAYRKRWETLLTDALYVIAPRGAWNEMHPAWPAARKALAERLRQESVALYAARRANIRRLMNQDSMRTLTADERQQAIAFFESPAGQVFADARNKAARADAYGLPPGIEAVSLAQLKLAKEKSLNALDALPEDRGDGKIIKDFLDSPAWKKLLRLQLEDWSDSVAFFLNTDIPEYVLKNKAELSRALRLAVPAIPPASDKTYLGTVAMARDNTFSVIVEHYSGLSKIGTYTLRYGPTDLHSTDIAALVPGIKPGESRFLYYDAAGRVSDSP